MKLQGEIDDVTKIMKKNLSDLLKREENLEGLMAKSKDLSTVSVEFYKKAKESNKKCCSLS
jgi:synaptobrevin family protein YKT6